MESPVKINNDALASTLSIVRGFHVEGKYYDVQLQVGTEIFMCQRSLLAGISEYFDIVFSGDFNESNISKDVPIILHGMDATAFREILNFIYTGNFCVTDSNVDKLIFMSDFLRLRTAHIEERCVEYAKNRSEKDKPMPNAVDLFSFACMKDKTILVDAVSAHICKHLRHYSVDDKLMEISFKSLDALLKYSKNYILALPGTENVVLKIILKWVSHSREERKEYRHELMKNINFSNISSDLVLVLINRLENFADEVAGRTENVEIKSLAELQKFKMEIDLDYGDSRSAGIITFVVSNLSEKKMDEPQLSVPTMISNLSWKIDIRRQDENLKFSLRCEGTSKTALYNCYADAELEIVSQKKETKNILRRFHPSCIKFSTEHRVWGFSKFMSWADLINVEKGYIKDDCVIFRAHIYPDVPFQKKYLGLY